MKEINHSQHLCSICKKYYSQHEIIAGELVNKEITLEIKRTCPDWSSEQFICPEDLAMMRKNYIHSLLVAEKGELTSLQQAVLNSLHEQALFSTDIESNVQVESPIGERLADKIASFGGSWWFLISFGVFLSIWIGANSLIILWNPHDPYPFIFLNLLLSCLAAIQAPVIMMSQNRQETKDRIRSQYDYQINLKAEIEIRTLHEKIDYLLTHQWEKMARIQEIQIELLTELNQQKKEKTHQKET